MRHAFILRSYGVGTPTTQKMGRKLYHKKSPFYCVLLFLFLPFVLGLAPHTTNMTSFFSIIIDSRLISIHALDNLRTDAFGGRGCTKDGIIIIKALFIAFSSCYIFFPSLFGPWCLHKRPPGLYVPLMIETIFLAAGVIAPEKMGRK